uniref:Attacin C-terminal domain-containing protein n=1 Tax=Anopheles culicifacies TaxID=139723 RepID=A0A182MG74_9DIPT
MTRSYYWLALVITLLLLLQLTLGELQRTAAAANPIGKAPGGSSTPPERSERIRAHLAGGFIDDAMAHKNGAPQRHAYGSDVDHRRPHAAGSGRKMGTVRGTSGPIHTYIKTDKNANFKWGVRHFVGAKYAR